MVTIKKVHAIPEENAIALHSHTSNGHATDSISVNSDGVSNHTLDGKNGSDTQEIHFANSESSWTENMVEKGKDLISSEASGIATAAAIVVGAALIEIELIPGLVIGAGAVLLGKIFPEISGYARPIFKSFIKAGFSAAHKIRQVLAETNEQVNDLVAEVKSEQKDAVDNLHAQTHSESKKVDLSTH